METLDNLGYSTYVLKTIRSVTECTRILVYDRNVFIGSRGYGRLNLYSLNDIFYGLLYDKDLGVFNESCLVLERTLGNTEEEYENIPFEYTCNNPVTNGFNTIIYLEKDNSPAGYTEFIGTQGRISDYIRIYLKYNIEIGSIDLKLNNSLYKIKDKLYQGFIGEEPNKFPSSEKVKTQIDKLPKNQKYTSHLSNFLSPNNVSNIFLGNRVIDYTKSVTKLNLLHDIDIFSGEEYSNYQIGYYGDDIVLYAWTYIEDSIGYYYRITSLVDGKEYKNTQQTVDGEYKDIIEPYDKSREVSKELLYCAGKYLVFNVSFSGISNSIVALFDTSVDSWLKTDKPNLIVDPLDRTLKIHELPKSTLILSYDIAVELFPEVSDIFLDLRGYVQNTNSLLIKEKIGDWFVIKDFFSDLYIFSSPSMSIYMTYSEYKNCVVVNNNTILLDSGDYYIIYHGPQRKIYYTEKARCLLENKSLIKIDLGEHQIMVCDSMYEDLYRKSEIAIVFKDSMIFDGILDSYRKQPLYNTYKVPEKIIGAVGGIIYYIDKYNKINYI